MGRHSRRGPAPKGDSAETTAGRDGRNGQGGLGGPDGQDGHESRDGRDGQERRGRWSRQEGRGGAETRDDGQEGLPGRPGAVAGPGAMPGGQGPQGAVPPGREPSRRPAHGGPRLPDGTPAHGGPRLPDGTPAHGGPRLPDGTPAHGVPRLHDGTPAPGVPRVPGGTPAQGVPRLTDGIPARGVPRPSDGTPAPGVPQARGGHPEQREAGGGWGRLGSRSEDADGPRRGRRGGTDSVGAVPSAGPALPIPRQRQAPPGGPRQDYLDAFDEDGDVFAARSSGGPQRPDTAKAATAAVPPARKGEDFAAGGPADGAAPDGEPPARGKAVPKGRTFAGIAAAAVTTVLAVVVAGQVADGHTGTRAQAAPGGAGDVRGSTAADGRAGATASPRAVTLTYAQKMDTKYPLSPTLKGPGKFETVPGFAKAPGTGRKYTYRVDIEQGLGLEGRLFADAVQKTLNDHRSWAHGGARTFERISSGRPDFVITLASPGTTAVWCAKSGLDTTEDNVSCDSAATERVMINAYRWAQGSQTYGDAMYAYRQMLINHEVGHRLGHNHVTCQKDGALAPVMQQQTKFLDHDGIHCLPNAWPYPAS
ncbi:DUF3152 domain-containing protein [Streptomyces sp. NPDC093260]|uniref:DUF3152 domain-containing protein n=1 Tax=Streptomyces sp. NPDC093260 TaxID=3155073 RepID=UPI003425E531